MKANEKEDIIEFLLKNTDYSKSKIKSLIKYKMVLVNNKKISLPFILNEGDVVEIGSAKTVISNNHDLDIIYEDKEIVVVNKPSGLLTIATEKEKENTLYRQVSEYVKKGNKNANIFIVHRLDKDTSGIVLFAKNESLKHSLQDKWNDIIIKRGYIAVCEGIFDNKEDTLKSYLIEKGNNVYVTNKKEGKEAITKYKVIKESKQNSMLEIELETGRKNQIRVQMKEINHPVIGDKKYLSNINPIKRLALHANILIVKHPITGKILNFKIQVPRSFSKALGNK